MEDISLSDDNEDEIGEGQWNGLNKIEGISCIIELTSDGGLKYSQWNSPYNIRKIEKEEGEE